MFIFLPDYLLNILVYVWLYRGAVDSIAMSWLPSTRFDPGLKWSFAYSPCLSAGFVWVIWFSPTAPKHGLAAHHYPLMKRVWEYMWDWWTAITSTVYSCFLEQTPDSLLKMNECIFVTQITYSALNLKQFIAKNFAWLCNNRFSFF